jgi:hypothetical protein
METLSFALGMLAMVAIVLVVVIVVGIVKVYKQQKELKSTQEWLTNFERNVWQSHEEWRRDIDRRENNIYNALADNGRDLHQMIEDKYTGAIGMANAYTDSRLDKFEQKITGTLGAKQVIKG